MEYVDMTPKWADIIDIYIASLEAGRESGKVAARDEIRRLARQYDAACDYVQELEKAIGELLASWDMEQDTREHNQRDRMGAAVAAMRELIEGDK